MLRMLGIVIGLLGTAVFLSPAGAGIFNFGNWAGTGLSLVLLLCCLFEGKLITLARRFPAADKLLRLLQGAYILFLVLAAVISALMYGELRNLPKEGEERTMIVLGCGLEGNRPSQMLAHRLRRAESWLREHPQMPVIVSGGQGTDEVISEAACMHDWLVSHGIEEERIYMEDRSTATHENLIFSREIIDSKGLPEKIVVVTNNFHSYRAALIAKKCGYTDVRSLPAKTTWWLFPTSVMREYFAVPREWIRQYR